MEREQKRSLCAPLHWPSTPLHWEGFFSLSYCPVCYNYSDVIFLLLYFSWNLWIREFSRSNFSRKLSQKVLQAANVVFLEAGLSTAAYLIGSEQPLSKEIQKNRISQVNNRRVFHAQII